MHRKHEVPCSKHVFFCPELDEGRGAVPGGALVLLGSNNDGRGVKEEGIPIKGKRPM